MSVSDMQIDEDIVENIGRGSFTGQYISNAITISEKMFKDKNCVRFVAVPAHIMASGVRGLILELVKKKKIDVIIGAGGCIVHDLMKGWGWKHEIGSFNEDDKLLHKKNINRIGNILLDNKHYENFEDKIQVMLKKIAPKKIGGNELIKEIAKMAPEDTVLHQCLKNNVLFTSPTLLDSAFGLQLFFYRQDHSDFVIDQIKDMQELAAIVFGAKKTGAFMLGGGVTKHHTMAANLLRNGLNYAVDITAVPEWDGSISGARISEGISWGKINEGADCITIPGDATLIFPIIINAVKHVL